MTRYLLIVNFEGGVVETPMEEWKPEEVTAHLDYYRALHKELVDSGELVASEVLVGPDLAKIVTFDGLTAPVVTDGPFQEFKEWVAGYQIIDVESEERAIEIAGEALRGARAGRDRDPAADPRAADDGPTRRPTSTRWRRSCSRWAARAEGVRRRRGPAARARRRRSSARSSAGTATSTPPRTRCRRRCSPRRSTGRGTGVPESPRGWLLQTAARRLIDQWRSEQSRRDRESVALAGAAGRRTSRIEDDTLTVLFMCCHPALTPASAIALTLRAVGGLTTAEIASAFLVAEATMAQRISRARSSGSRPPACRSGCRPPDERPAGCARCCTCST